MSAVRCEGTASVSRDEAVSLGWIEDVNTYGRRVCTTCHGIVQANRDGTLRKHVAGSNR